MLHELAKLPRSPSRQLLRRRDTTLGHLRFDLTVLIQASKAREKAEKQEQAPRTISVADLAARLTE